jgi:replicative DNA helicase
MNKMKNELVNKIITIIGNQSADENELVAQLREIVFQAELKREGARESKGIAALVYENLKRLNEGVATQNVVKTGFAEFDKLFGGLALGELIVIGGRPSMGKTQFLINLSLNISSETPLLYFTHELCEASLTNRFLSSISGIANKKINERDLSENELYTLAYKGSKLSKQKIFINDSCRNSISSLRAHCEKHIRENGVKVIVVDYLQLMTHGKYRNHRDVEIGILCKEMKSIAKDYDVCVVVASQLSRAVDSRVGWNSKQPLLSDLAESGSIEQDADKVIFLYRPEYYKITEDANGNSVLGLIDIIVAKNRTGSVGRITLEIDIEFTNIFERGSHPTGLNVYKGSQINKDESDDIFPDYQEFVKSQSVFSFSPERINEIEKEKEKE